MESPTEGRRGNRQGRELQHLGSGGDIGQEKEPWFVPAARAEPRVRKTAPDKSVQELLADLAAHDNLMSGTLVEGIWLEPCNVFVLAGCAGGFFGVGLDQDEHLVAPVARALAIGFEALTAVGSFLSALVLLVSVYSLPDDFSLPRFSVLDRFRSLETFLVHRPFSGSLLKRSVLLDRDEDEIRLSRMRL